VRRTLTIKSDPPGALVYVNDQLKGATPLTYDFTWYGSYRVTLRKEGYDRLDDRRLLRAPVYLWIPFDLVMELLPLPVRDTKTWLYTLTPAAAPATPVPPLTGTGHPAAGGVGDGHAEAAEAGAAASTMLLPIEEPSDAIR
jgi:hypothetical protein